MVETDFSGNFANEENCKDNDIVEIKSEGSYEDKKNQEGKPYRIFNIDIKNGEKNLIYSPSVMTGKRMQKAWGTNSKEWIGKKATVKHLLKQVFGNVKTYIELYPLEAEKK